MRRLTIALALIAVAACSQSQPEPEETETAAANAGATPSGTQTNTPPATPPSQVALVPDRFHGIWDYEKGSCDPASDLRVEIAERGITFYESHGAVTALTVESPEVIVVDLAMQGEGETWTMKRRFTLSNGDRTLVPEAVGGENYAPMPLKRCA